MTSTSPAFRWFMRLWAVAILAHVIGNPRFMQVWPEQTALGVGSLLLGLSAAVLLAVPDSRVLLVSAVGVLAVAWFEAPFIGNHWVAASFVSIAILLAPVMSNPWSWFSRTARWILLGFYSWAAFNKLNAGFFDPDVTCGAVYANQWLDAAGLPTIPMGGFAAWAVAAATTAIELTVPVLLLIPRTRRWGVLLGFGFHGLISLDLGQHFYDFTALLLALFTLFLGDDVMAAIEERVGSPARRWLPGSAIAGFFVILSVGSLTTSSLRIVTKGIFVVWIPVLVGIVAVTVWAVRDRDPIDVPLRIAHPASIVLVALVVFNGFTPYLELKTGYGWNMYANLVTTRGESNHYVLRATVPLTDVQERLAEIVETDDPGLQAYVGSDYVLPESRLLHYLADHPQASVTYFVDQETVTGSGAELGERLPVLVDKFQLFRAVDAQRPVRCQTTWLPAR